MKSSLLCSFIAILLYSCSTPKPTNSPNTSDCSFLEGIEDYSRLKCGRLEVPENHDKPNGKKISIAYVVLKSEDSLTTQYPMIYFTGGPGGPALRSITQNLNNPILKTRDIIRFDQRGIGYSSPLPDLTTRIYDLLAEDLTSEQEYESMKRVMADLRNECDEKSIEIEAYNTFQNANDVGMLMDHLGYEKYNLRGTSYGTRIARVVADKFPEKIHSAIYDSPAPVRSDFLTSRLDDYSLALRKVFDACESSPYCNEKYPNIEQTYMEVLGEAEEQPIAATYQGEPFYLNPQDLIFMVRKELYRNDSRDLVPRYIYSLKERDMASINLILEQRGSTTANYSMFLACESFSQYDTSVTEEALKLKYDSLELMPYELALFTSLYLASSKFMQRYATPDMLELNVSSIPSLLLINQFDPVTPPENVIEFESKITFTQSFTLDEGGHGGGDMVCKRAIYDQFMTNPMGELDTDCLKLWNPI
ncbi:MAG: alpha/beta fold hydrolase [Cyclobacteriaceae bacterium]